MKRLKKAVLCCLSNRRGSSLLECIISLVLFTAIMIMITSMLTGASIISLRSKDLEDAVNDAVNKAEVLSETTQTQEVILDFAGGPSVKAQLLEVTGTASEGAAETDKKEVKIWRLAPVLSAPEQPGS